MPQAGFTSIECWVFDLDNTLYPPSADLFGQIDQRMTAFIERQLGVSRSKADHLRHLYWQEHGTTLAGLQLHHDVVPEHFLTDAHNIDYSELTHDPALFQAIANTPGRKIVHTNGPRCHAQAVLTSLGYSELFDAVYALEDANLISKPHAGAFETVHAQAGIEPGRSAMIEDDARNLTIPHRLAMRTIWLDHGRAERKPDHVHHHVSCLTTFLNSGAQEAG